MRLERADIPDPDRLPTGRCPRSLAWDTFGYIHPVPDDLDKTGPAGGRLDAASKEPGRAENQSNAVEELHGLFEP